MKTDINFGKTTVEKRIKSNRNYSKKVLQSKIEQDLKNMGYTKYIFTKEQIQKLIDENGIIDGYKPNYFN